MPCKTIRTGPDAVAVLCSRGSRAKPCASCGKGSVALCDFPLTGTKAGKTCDRPMCADHRTAMPGKDRDYCPVHAAMASETLPGVR